MLRNSISRVLTLAGACFAAVVPFFWRGSPSGHDFEFHVFSWMEVLGQWKHGIIYPRWAALAHWGYGEARFLFYPPASWTLGAALGAFLPWKMVPGAYCWIVLALAGAAMYRLGGEWLSPRDALFAAVFYALNPYHLLIVYWRSAYAELLSAVLLPLLVLCLVRVFSPDADNHFRPTLWLSLVLAAAWLTNAPAAVMIQYSAAGLALLLAVTGEPDGTGAARPSRSMRWRGLIQVGIAIVLGAGLASFYLIPAIYEQKWIDVTQVLSPGVRPQDNFLFTTLADVDHNHFNYLVSSLAVVEIGVLLLAIAYSRRRRMLTNCRTPWLLHSAWGLGCAILMLSVSNVVWQHLPKLRFMQLPFRWLLCMNAALAILLTMAFKRWMPRLMASAVLLAALVAAGYHFQPPWWDKAADFREMSDAMADGTGYEGTDEYVPAGVDAYELNKNLALVSDDAGAPVAAKILAWHQMNKHFALHAPVAENLTVRLFSYPAWNVLVNGQPVATQKSDITGLIVIPVGAGDNDVQIYFRRTLDRLVGNIVSLISVAIFVIVWITTRRRGTRERVGCMTHDVILLATSNPGKLRDLAGAAAPFNITAANLPNFSSLPQVVEDGLTFEANARKKAESYSLAVPGEVVVADDSGLEVDALSGAPGVYSARYAARASQKNDLRNDDPQNHALQNNGAKNNQQNAAEQNTEDAANNARVLRELENIPPEKRTARFVCVLAAARDGKTLATFRGTAEGVILDAPRGKNGFGYDPLFYFPAIQKTFAELDAQEKSRHSHRGAAFRAFLEWYRASGVSQL